MKRSGWSTTRITRGVLTMATSIAMLCQGFAASAQSAGGLDPAVLGRLQEQLGANAGRSSANLDTARESGDQQNQRDISQFPLQNERSEEHTSELQSLMRISYAVFCLKTKNKNKI